MDQPGQAAGNTDGHKCDSSTNGRFAMVYVYVCGVTEGRATSVDLLEHVRAGTGATADDTWVYPNPVRIWSRGPLARHALALSESIQQYWEHRGSPQAITLIGHSIGGLLVRYAYLQATGALGGFPREWSRHVRRIVLLATPNRGWDTNRLGRLGQRLSWLTLPLTKGFAVRDVLAGSAFMTALRLEWLREIGARQADAPVVVQVRSGQDTFVTSEDSRDVETLTTGVQLVLPCATHADIPRVTAVPEDFPGQRWNLLRKAVLEDVEPTTPKPLPAEDAALTSVVFILHGIRAGNDGWVEQLRLHLATQKDIRVVTGSYGRFSAYNFAIPVTRRRTLYWFLDQYSYLLARHPDLPFHFVGHSNGTYMLGQALKYVASIRFDRVFLAGSVLPAEFDWRGHADKRQVGRLVNVCASKDKPVAWLCSGLRGLRMRDIGVGGFTGFQEVPPTAEQYRYLPGGHGAALAPERLPDIAAFVRTGVAVPPPGLADSPPAVFGLVSRTAPILTSLTAISWLLAAGWLAFAGPLLLGGLLLFTVLIAIALIVA